MLTVQEEDDVARVDEPFSGCRAPRASGEVVQEAHHLRFQGNGGPPTSEQADARGAGRGVGGEEVADVIDQGPQLRGRGSAPKVLLLVPHAVLCCHVRCVVAVMVVVKMLVVVRCAE